MNLSEAARITAPLERAVEGHYRRFAAVWCDDPAIASFWTEMADAEKVHGDILEAAVEYFTNDPRSVPLDRERIAWACGVIEGAKAWPTPEIIDDALEIALFLERLEVDEVYEKIVRGAGDAFRAISRSIALSLEELAEHETMLEDMIRRSGAEHLLHSTTVPEPFR